MNQKTENHQHAVFINEISHHLILKKIRRRETKEFDLNVYNEILGENDTPLQN